MNSWISSGTHMFYEIPVHFSCIFCFTGRAERSVDDIFICPACNGKTYFLYVQHKFSYIFIHMIYTLLKQQHGGSISNFILTWLIAEMFWYLLINYVTVTDSKQKLHN